MENKKIFKYIIFILLFSISEMFATWTPQNSGVSTNLNSIYTRGTTSYAVGIAGTVIKTTNSGVNWTSLTSPTNSDIYSIYFNNSTTGFICATQGIIYKTSDGGSSWSAQNSNSTNTIKGISFSDASNGVLVTNTGEIRYTSTGGDNWISASSGLSSSLNSVYMIRSSDVIVCGDNGKIIKSLNAGITWYSVSSGTSANLRSIVINGSNGLAVGDGGVILKSTDEGETWTSVSSPTIQNLNTVSFGNSTRAYSAGDNGTIIMSTNSGANWTAQTSNSTAKLNGLSCETYLIVYALGNAGTILNTTSGGQNLTPSIKVNLPNGNESFKNSTAQVITWSSANVDNVIIKYSGNNGSTFTTLQVVTASSGSYSWTVPNELTNQALIKIEDASNNALFDLSDAPFSVYNWSFNLIQPISSSTWNIGSTQTINWYAENINNINIEYTTNNGTSWNSIVTNQLASTGNYNWVIPNIPTSNAKIKLYDTQNSSSSFVMPTAFLIQAPEVVLKTPNGGESLIAFNTYNITWSNINVANIDLDYSTNNGNTWNNIANGINANLGTYNWAIPNLNTQAIVRIKSSIDNLVNDNSNATFTISGFPIIVSSPNGNESWQSGTNKIITWSSTNEVFDVNIDYSVNNGNAWTRLASSVTASNGTFSWTVPSNLTTQALIKVSDANTSSTFSDKSNAVFTISNLQLSSSLTNINVIAGASQNISWTAYGTGNLSLLYSTDNGSSWVTIVSNINSSNTSYSWVTPVIPAQTIKLKIQNTLDGTIKSETNINLVQQSLVLLTPVSNDYLQIMKGKLITWTSSYVNLIKIDYSTDSGTNWNNIANGYSATSGSFSWIVPNSVTNSALVRIGYIKPASATYTYAQSDVFNITNATVNIVLPNGGEKLTANTNQLIKWKSTNVTTVDLLYSADNGNTWNLIVAGLNAALTSYSWTVPNIPSKDVLVKVKDSNKPTIDDNSDVVFSVTGVSLKFPLTNDKLLVNSNSTISWISNDISKVNIFYSIDNGSSWIEIIRNYPAIGGNYSWQIPNNPSLVAKLRILDAQNSTIRDSSSNLTMQGMIVTSPKLKDTLLIGETSNITWRSADIGEIKIDYSTNGSTWTTITSNADAITGLYAWEVPETPSNTARLRLTHLSNPSFTDISSTFTIYGDGIVIKSPKAGDVLTSATSKTITWAVANTNIVKIEYSSDNGSNWKLISDSILATKKFYAWTVADSTSRDYLIRISDAENADISTTSGKFSVRGANGFKVPQSWAFTTTTGTNAIAIIPNINSLVIPKVLDSNIVQGSAIGAFYTINGVDYCAGYVTWDTTKNNYLTIWGDNPQTSAKDGYSIGETINYKIWDSQNGIEYNATVTYQTGSGTFANDGVYVISSMITHKSLNIPIRGNRWSIISSNLLPNDLKIISMLSAIKPNMEYIKNDAGNTYYPTQNINTITNWNMANGYQIYMNNNDTLKIKGINVNVTNYSIPIVKDAWQMISFLPKDSMAVTTVFSGITSLRMLKDQDGSIYYPAFGINNISYMKPGSGYKINSSLAFTFSYPSGSGAIAPISNINQVSILQGDDLPSHFVPSMSLTGSSAVLVINSKDAEFGDEFGIFNSKNLLIGSVLYKGEDAVITIWGDDISTPVKTDGALENESLKAKLWKNGKNKEYALDFDNIADIINGKVIKSGLKYKQDAIYQADALVNGISDVENSVSNNEILISPNPAKKYANVLFNLDDNKNINIEIYNTVGQILKVVNLGYRMSGLVNCYIDTEDLQSGVYLLSIKTGESIRTEKLIIHE